MKKVVLIPIIIGSALLVIGGTMFAIGVANNNQSGKIINTTKDIDETFENIDIDFDTTDLNIVLADNGKAQAVFQEREKEYHTVKVEENTLKLSFVNEIKWYERLFTFNIKPLKCTLYLPTAAYSNLKIKSSTGDTTISKEFTFNNVDFKCSTGNLRFNANVVEELKVNASTGDIYLNDMSSKSANITVSTGNVNLNKVAVNEKLFVKTSTGKIKTTDVTCKDLETNTSTGDVTLTNTIAANHIEMKASTGDIKFVDSDAETLNVKTSTGNVSGTILTSKVFVAISHTGKIHVPETTTGGLCRIETDTGDINIKLTA